MPPPLRRVRRAVPAQAVGFGSSARVIELQKQVRVAWDETTRAWAAFIAQHPPTDDVTKQWPAQWKALGDQIAAFLAEEPDAWWQPISNHARLANQALNFLQALAGWNQRIRAEGGIAPAGPALPAMTPVDQVDTSLTAVVQNVISSYGGLPLLLLAAYLLYGRKR